MNLAIVNTLKRIGQNKHTSGAAVALVALETIHQLAPIWFPAKQAQIESSIKIIQKAVIGYGLLMAGDSQKPIDTIQDKDQAKDT